MGMFAASANDKQELRTEQSKAIMPIATAATSPPAPRARTPTMPPAASRRAPPPPTRFVGARDEEEPMTIALRVDPDREAERMARPSFMQNWAIPKTKPNPRGYNAPVKQKYVEPLMINTYGRQPGKRPTKFGPPEGCGNRPVITPKDVDVVYDEFNWAACNGCFNQAGIYPEQLNPVGISGK